MKLSVHPRKGMDTLIKEGKYTVASVKDKDFVGLLGSAANLREQLDLAVLILDNVPGLSVDTTQMKRVLEESKVEG